MKKTPRTDLELAHSREKDERPTPGTEEFDAWLTERARKRAETYFSGALSLDPDDERGLISGGYNRLNMSDEELAEEERLMDEAEEKERRKHLKLVPDQKK